LNVRQKGKERMMISPKTIKTNRIKGRAQVRPTLQAIVAGNHTPGLNLCVPSVTTIMKVLVHLGAIIARGLAMRPRTVESDLPTTTTTTATTTTTTTVTTVVAFGGREVWWWWVLVLMGLQLWMSSLVEVNGGVVVELVGEWSL
ncbi:hypothetical protein Tco_1552618, partial [Tanacetum coccineum]